MEGRGVEDGKGGWGERVARDGWGGSGVGAAGKGATREGDAAEAGMEDGRRRLRRRSAEVEGAVATVVTLENKEPGAGGSGGGDGRGFATGDGKGGGIEAETVGGGGGSSDGGVIGEWRWWWAPGGGGVAQRRIGAEVAGDETKEEGNKVSFMKQKEERILSSFFLFCFLSFAFFSFFFFPKRIWATNRDQRTRSYLLVNLKFRRFRGAALRFASTVVVVGRSEELVRTGRRRPICNMPGSMLWHRGKAWALISS